MEPIDTVDGAGAVRVPVQKTFAQVRSLGAAVLSRFFIEDAPDSTDKICDFFCRASRSSLVKQLVFGRISPVWRPMSTIDRPVISTRDWDGGEVLVLALLLEAGPLDVGEALLLSISGSFRLP